MNEQLDPIPDDLVGAAEAARLARCHLSAVHRWRLSGRLRGWRRCGRWFFSRADVLALFETPAARMLPPSETERHRAEAAQARRLEAVREELRRRGYGA